MISYNRLWETMEKRKISQYRLIKEFGLSSGQMSRLKKNTYVSTHTLETLCRILDCRIEDVMEVSFEDEKKENEAN
ncbi:helix-turn-helix transcriptional regulator [butyrate-producing bacterium]|mgnify:FL=1|nr:helix-turn-helix transcriptional regulator [butyrate-producing bacterium]MBS5642268.1 helix-turn-helix transcriptional regulator [butyrate-producing bacterium]